MDDCLSSRLIDYKKQVLDDPVTLIKQYLHRMSVLLRRQYNGSERVRRASVIAQAARSSSGR